MRKGLGLLFAISLCLPVGVLTAGSAGSAVNTVLPKCKAFSGTQTFVPALPKSGDSHKVKPKTTTKLTITGCTGGGITSGKSNGVQTATTATNCNTLFANAGKPGKPTTGTITWSNGQTSQTSNVLTVTGASKDLKTLNAKLVTTYTGGLGKGKKSTATVVATPNSGWCTKVPFKSTTFKSTSIK